VLRAQSVLCLIGKWLPTPTALLSDDGCFDDWLSEDAVASMALFCLIGKRPAALEDLECADALAPDALDSEDSLDSSLSYTDDMSDFFGLTCNAM